MTRRAIFASLGQSEASNTVMGPGLLLVLTLATACSVAPVVEESVEPILSASESVAPTSDPSASMLPALSLPGANLDEPAGEYGWTGAPGSVGGMHRVVVDGDAFRQTQLTFAVADDCFAYGTDAEPVPVTVAGLDGLYFEPYEDPGVVFVTDLEAGQVTGAYALPIGDRTVCVYLTWDAATTQAELDAARQVVDSIRGQPFGPHGIRINFTLPFGWDTG